jgi:hypothetical protein
MSADAKAAAEDYRETFRRSQDPLIGLLRKVGDGAGGVGDWVGSGMGWVRDRARGPRPNGEQPGSGRDSSGDQPDDPWGAASDGPAKPRR